MGFLFLGVMVSVFSFQYLFGGQIPFSQKVIYFSSPDSFSAFDKITYLRQLDTAKRLEAIGNPQYNLIQNTLSFLPGTCSSNPGYLFFLNSIIHTFCGLLIFFILKKSFTNTGAVVGMAVFVLNPTYLEWTANLLKDGIFIAGGLLCIFSIYRQIDKPCPTKIPKIAQNMGLWCVGLFLIYKSRFYFLDLCAVFGLLVLGFYIFETFRKFKAGLFQKKRGIVFVSFVASVVFLVLTPIWLSLQGKELSGQDFNYFPNAFSQGESNNSVSHINVINDIKWKLSQKVPDFIEKKLFVFSVRRQGFLNTAGYSKVDEDIKIQSTLEFISYFPKAFVNGWFSPFPNSWFQKGSSEVHSLGRKVLGYFSLFYWPLLISGGFYFWKNRENNATLVLCGISLVGVLFFAYLVPNIGALNRMRYVFYMLWIAFGATYFVELITARFSARASSGKTAN